MYSLVVLAVELAPLGLKNSLSTAPDRNSTTYPNLGIFLGEEYPRFASLVEKPETGCYRTTAGQGLFLRYPQHECAENYQAENEPGVYEAMLCSISLHDR